MLHKPGDPDINAVDGLIDFEVRCFYLISAIIAACLY